MKTSTRDQPVTRPAAEAPQRLMADVRRDGGTIGLAAHLAKWGPLDLRAARHHLVDELDKSGLVGHGGAWFPVATKWRSVHGGISRRPVVVANGAEGEPASAKDAMLLARTPHLVLDGASAAAAALGATRVVAYVPGRLAPGVSRAIEERRGRRLDPAPIEVFVAPEAFIAGQESAVVNALNGRGDALPSFLGLHPIRERGVDGRPTLVQNVETLAHVGLVARFGSSWFRAVGTERFPGTMLLSLSGRYRTAVVVEAPLGVPLREVVSLDDHDAAKYLGALVGGYGGTWVSMPTLLQMDLTEESARAVGATLGPGVVILLPRSVCPLAEVARVVRYMERQSAGQCGPCVHGLAGLDEALHALAFAPRVSTVRLEAILELCSLVDGRGACRHPDGVARFVRSACAVFSAEVAAHLRAGPCSLVDNPSVLAFRGPRPARSRPRELALR